VFLKSLQDHPGVEGVPSKAAKSSSCRRVRELPSESDAAELGVDQDGSVSVVPSEPQKAGLAAA